MTLPKSLVFLGLVVMVSQAIGANIVFTIDDIGLQTLSFKGQSFLSGALPTTDSFIGDILWEALDTHTETTVTRPAISQATLKTHGANYVEHTYGTGSRTCTVRCTYSASDFRTLLVKTEVTNTSATEAIQKLEVFPFGYFFRTFAIPGSSSVTRPGTQYIHLGGIGGGNGHEVDLYPSYLFQGSWGHCAIWAADVSENSSLLVPWTTSAGQTAFTFRTRNFSYRSTANSVSSVYFVDAIAPTETWTYEYYVRFGLSSSATLGDIAPTGTDSAREAFPLLTHWTNRNPVSRGFLCASTETSVTNPRGYFYDDTIDVSNSANFLSLVTTWANQTVARMDAMDPKPQGIIIWDLEGNPNDASVYRGAPHLIATLSPEMDGAANAFFSIFHNAGYFTGMTLRPDTLALVGGVWTHVPVTTEEDAVTALATRVSYARNRWGSNVRLFYIDSDYLDINADGTSDITLPFRVFRTLQLQFPDCLFLPETENVYYYSCSGPYDQVNNEVSTPQAARDIYRQSFTVLSPFGVTPPFPTAAVTEAVRNGDVLFLDGYRTTSLNDDVLAIYQAASQ